MSPNAIVVRHANSGVPLILAKHMHCQLLMEEMENTPILPKLYSICLRFIIIFKVMLKVRKICIVGDIKNSRVAASNIELLSRFNLDITLVAPPHFMPNTHLKKHYKLDENIIAKFRYYHES